jgi:hypothetical protein
VIPLVGTASLFLEYQNYQITEAALLDAVERARRVSASPM